MVIFDTDILSMFAKIDAISLLKPKTTFLLISLQAILKALWKKKIRGKEEVRHLLERILENANLIVDTRNATKGPCSKVVKA